MTLPNAHQDFSAFPRLNSPVVEIGPDGRTSGLLSRPWYRLIISLWQRSGGTVGQASGTATLAGGTTNVDFPTLGLPPQLNTDYKIVLGGSAGETFHWSAKATTGFTITSSNGASTAEVDWFVIP